MWAQKRKKLMAEIILNFTITFPTIWRVAGDFFKVLWKFKIAAMDELHNSKIIVRIDSHFTITLPTIWKCAGDFTEI